MQAQYFAKDTMAQNMANPSDSIIEQLSRQASNFTNTSLNLPQHLEETLTRLEQGDLKLRINSVEANRELRQLSSLVQALIYTILFSTFFLSATQLMVGGWYRVSLSFFGLALVTLFLLIRLLWTQKKYPNA